LATLQQALQQAAKIDRLIKGLRVPSLIGDGWDALMELGLLVATGNSSPRPRPR
jgi:DNA polymerase-3 subunit delta